LLGLTAFLLAGAWQATAVAEVRIAVIDSGARGHVDAAISFTSYAGDSDPLNHGTEIAKLIRQENPDAVIYMLQVCENRDGRFKPSKAAVLQAIRWAVENQIDVVNMSLVVKYSKEIDAAVTEAAVKHGIIFVAAAGNKGLSSHFSADSDGFIRKQSKAVAPAFPSSNSNVISVGGLDERGQIASYSHKLCDIYDNGKILGQEGSSFACARVTAKVARILARSPQATKSALLMTLQNNIAMK
jgi:minor extracellular protease Epr